MSINRSSSLATARVGPEQGPLPLNHAVRGRQAPKKLVHAPPREECHGEPHGQEQRDGQQPEAETPVREQPDIPDRDR